MTEDEYTPTTEEIRAHYCGGARMRKRAEFDRWLAAHDAELEAEIARLSQRPSAEELRWAVRVALGQPLPAQQAEKVARAVLALFPAPKETPHD